MLIIYVEDDPNNVKLVKRLLKPKGHTLKAYKNAKSALRGIPKDKPALILLDLKLPDADGLDVARQLRSSGVTTPIIAVSAYGRGGDRDRAMAAGCQDFLEKPIDMDRFYAVLDRYLR